MPDEETPLLWDASALDDPHKQFCALSGVPPSNAKDKHPYIGPKTLYGRATHRYTKARRSHNFMAALNNTLLLSQVLLGATMTALGASESSHILITVFGVMNTVIAGLVAYLKSRGQPARTRMFRDDLERVVDEIENSETMWLGISQGIHGYDEIDIDDKVTVRSEVARLMRLYEKATRNFMMSNPDNYLMGQTDGSGTALRSRAGIGGGFPPAPVTLPAIPSTIPAAGAPDPSAPPAAIPAPPAEEDPDQSPATAPPKPPTPPPEEAKGKEPAADTKDSSAGSSKDTPQSSEDSKDKPPSYKATPPESKELSKPAVPPQSSAETPAEAPPAADPDESPATAAKGFEKSDDEDEDDKKMKAKS
ncbi:uncharacterized protein HMPREF1541_03140 [Cyphellophora europaea CBS 101466]|uniref:SMODS and SLOG-associating 2TM effector domain-containing protein n=1 Tax=Cyphellophora europaea (strain CBS 101466) TaxID=1220924 RepID=W2RXZ8_CYPE1|nr:uncharacterized protein HMPREF1541_03140 [Cyphellophora europaea CBS 101466]ETN41205.1 hypothetical protein HMPREF1541_03140 [Cyphellophora europaea CBS 101466]